jgi:hypothetical protein
MTDNREIWGRESRNRKNLRSPYILILIFIILTAGIVAVVVLGRVPNSPRFSSVATGCVGNSPASRSLNAIFELSFPTKSKKCAR